MRNEIRKTALFTATALAALCTACAHEPAQPAAQAAAGPDRTFTEATGQMALDAQSQMSAGDMDGAMATLNAALARETSPYERYTLLRMRGSARYEQDDIAGAIADWQAARATGEGTPEERAALDVNIGQLMIISGRVDEGAPLLENWMRTNAPSETVTMTLAQALAQDEQHARALPYARQSFDLAMPAERKHYDLLTYLYTQLDMQDERAATLRARMQAFPDDDLGGAIP